MALGGGGDPRPAPRGQAIGHLADEPIPRLRDCAPTWNALWCIVPRPDGRPTAHSSTTSTSGGPRRVRAGIAITTVFHEVLHPDITAVPLEGVAPSHVVVAIRVGDRSRLVAAFRNLAQVHLTGPEPHLTLRPCCVTDQTV